METQALDGNNVKEDFYDLLKEMFREIKKKQILLKIKLAKGKR